MTKRIAIMGAGGRMGHALVRCSTHMDGVEVAAAVERADHPSVGQDVGLVAGIGVLRVTVTTGLDALRDADVVVDFSHHRAVPEHVEAARQGGKAMVIGTTGLSERESAVVRQAGHAIPIVWAANMSLGVSVLLELVQQAAAVLGLDYDAEIVDLHHRHKQDAPSGTALALAQRVAAGRGQSLDAVACHGRQGIVGARPRGQIGLHAVRAGNAVGDHTVILGADCERLELSHRASSRDAFAMGALRAAVWVAGRDPGLYGMKDVLGL